MKLNYIFTFAIVLFSAAWTANAQSTGSMRIASVAVDPSDVVEVRFPSLAGGPNVRVFSGDIDASSEDGCMGSRDFSGVRPVGPDTARLFYDITLVSTYRLQWTVPKSLANECRVLVVGETTSSGEYAIWRANYGSAGLASDSQRSNARLGQIVSPSWGYDRID